MSRSPSGPRTVAPLADVTDLVPGVPLEVVLRRVLRRACHETGAARGLLALADPDLAGGVRVVTHGLGEAEHERLQDDETARLALLRGDVPALAEGHVVAEVRSADSSYGHLHLLDKQRPGGPGFDERDEQLVAVLASVLGPAVDHVRVHERSERQRAWAEAAADIGSVLVGRMSRDSALQLVADRARSTVDADFVAVLLPSGDTDLAVEVVAGRDVPPALVGELTRPDGLPAEVVRTGSGLVVPDTELEPLYLPGEEERWPQLRSVILLPLPGDEHVGVLALGWRERLPAGSWQLDPTLPQRFCDQAGLVLEVAQARADRDRLAVLEDRERIGRDLHDFVIQRLYGTALGLEVLSRSLEPGPVADQVAQAVDQLDETIHDIRRTIFELSTAEDDGVRTELLRLSDVVARSVGFRPRLVVDGPVDTLVVGPLRHQVLGVLGEAVSNAMRHAAPTSIDVEVRASVQDGVVVRVTDDGRGLRGASPRGGLLNMAHRAEGLGGSCVVRDRPDGGVEVLWQVPGEAVR